MIRHDFERNFVIGSRIESLLASVTKHTMSLDENLEEEIDQTY